MFQNNDITKLIRKNWNKFVCWYENHVKWFKMVKYDILKLNMKSYWNEKIIYWYEWFEEYKFLKEKSYFEIVFKVFEIFWEMIYAIWKPFRNYFGNVYKYNPILCERIFWNKLISNFLG